MKAVLDTCCAKHEPDNRFVECALAIGADYLVWDTSVVIPWARLQDLLDPNGPARVMRPANSGSPSAALLGIAGRDFQLAPTGHGLRRVFSPSPGRGGSG